MTIPETPTPAPTPKKSNAGGLGCLLVLGIIVWAVLSRGSGSSSSAAATQRPTQATPAAAWAPADYTISPDPKVAYRWLSSVTCTLDSCWGIEAIARDGCPNSLYVELSITDSSGAAVGYTNDVAGAVAPGQHAKMTFENTEERGKNATVSKVSCY
jgi:hypothetical protein